MTPLSAGTRRTLAAGSRLYAQGDAAESVFHLVSGAIELRSARDGATRALRSLRGGERFGEECVLEGARRTSSAVAIAPSTVIEIPIAVYRRHGAKSGELAAVERRLQRAVCKDALRDSPLGEALSERDLERIAAEVEIVRFARGERLYAAGDRASAGYVVVDGLVRLESALASEEPLAFLGRGELFGDEEALSAGRREHGAVALGDTSCLELSEPVLLGIERGYPGLLRRARRVLGDRRARQQSAIVRAGARATGHVFKDVYRLQIARSLLAIDLDRCVRCGHCAYACAETHGGVSRLVRRGDKIVTRVREPIGDVESSAPKSLLLPNTCQHCASAACLVECPTGAIGREPGGEVFIREELCTGCGACAKACPWENIQLAPRAAPIAPDQSAEVAVKCDLCREQSGPACVTACPTDAIARVEPARAFDELGALLGSAPEPASKSRRESRLPLAALLGGTLVGLVFGLELARRDAELRPSEGTGLAFGVLAAVIVLGAAAHVLPKRALGLWLRVRGKLARPPSQRKLTMLHGALGIVALAAAVGHAGFGSARGAHFPLRVSLWTAVVSGALSMLAYRVLPRLLTPLEPSGLLPEDFAAERQRLLDAVESQVSRRSAIVKVLLSRLLLPHTNSALALARWVAAGDGLRAEQRRLRARADGVLAGRARDKLDGLDALVRSSVELSALRGRRWLTALLRGLPLLHAISSLVFVLLLLAHVGAVLWARVWLWSLS